jgi:hypothetical protein
MHFATSCRISNLQITNYRLYEAQISISARAYSFFKGYNFWSVFYYCDFLFFSRRVRPLLLSLVCMYLLSTFQLLLSHGISPISARFFFGDETADLDTRFLTLLCGVVVVC